MRTAICSVIALACATGLAHATPYESFIDVDDEGDLQDLFSSNTITEDTYNELLDLLTRGVDLSTADRNDLYALPNLTYEDVDAIIAFRNLKRGRIVDPAELAKAGVVSEEKLLAISSFLIVRTPGENPLAAHGFVRVMTRASYHDFAPEGADPFLPPIGLRTRFTAARYLTVGAALTTSRLKVGPPVYDQVRDALVAEPREYRVHIPKAYVRWETSSMNAIVGSYRAGFGQRLIFDNAQGYTPNGLYLDDQLYYSQDLSGACNQSGGELLASPCTGAPGDEYVTPDFIWRNGLFGAAIGAKHVELSSGWMQAYAWASASKRSIYQYELVDAGKCADPHDDNDPACAAPDVFVKPKGDLLTPTTRHSFATLSDVFQERLVGGNVAYYADRRNSVGLTAFGAQEKNLVEGIDLDFQEWSRLPNGKRFGAVGANFSAGSGWLDIFGEAGTSFDSMHIEDRTLTPAKGGGGPAAILRMTATRKKEELEVVGRYYSADYANPYSRPISQSDEFEGQRARNEAGARVRYIRNMRDFVVRALADVWVNPQQLPTGDRTGPKLDTYIRANVRTTPVLWLGLWERYQDKDLERGGHDQCYEISSDTDESGEPVPCGGRQINTIVRSQYQPNNRLSMILQLQHQLLDDNTQMELKNKFRQDVAVWFIMHWRPTRNMRMRARVRYLDEAINDNTYLERSIAGLVDTAFRVREKDTFRFRIDVKQWLDKRMSTLDRQPNPEVSGWLFYEARL